ncbi:hypothetical protein ACOSQ3_015084 [Xanthoceras sorbifolium]
MLVNCILKHGKKSLAYQIIYRALKKIQQKIEKKSTICFTSSNTWSESTHQVPIEIGSAQFSLITKI